MGVFSEARMVLGEFLPQADCIRIPMELPADVRFGHRGMGDLLLNDTSWGRTYLHEFVHHLQTITTLSGVRLFHYRWDNRVRFLSHLDGRVLALLRRGVPFPGAVETLDVHTERLSQAMAYCAANMERFTRLYGKRPITGVPSVETSSSTALVTWGFKSFHDPLLPGAVTRLPFVRVDCPDGESIETTLGAFHIREASAMAAEVLFARAFLHGSDPSALDELNKLKLVSDPWAACYTIALNFYLACVTEPRFRDVETFALVCELALMYDPILAEYAERIDEHETMTRFSSQEEMRAFWSRDHGAGGAFARLVWELSRNANLLPSFDKKTGGEDLYLALSEQAGIPISCGALESAVRFVDSRDFVFGDEAWSAFLGPTRARIRRGLRLRAEHCTRPLLSFVTSEDLALLFEVSALPTLTCYTNTVTGPTADTEEITLLLFDDIVASLWDSGKVRCLLKYEYPWMCKASKSCRQGQELLLGPERPRVDRWCPYAKGLLVVDRWLSGNEDDGQRTGCVDNGEAPATNC